jgi:glycosyltransferase involved in cell wall biosynthesis
MFSPIFAPFGNPEAIVNSKLALAFLHAGWQVDVVSRRAPAAFGYSYGSEWGTPWLELKGATHEVSYAHGNVAWARCEALFGAVKLGSLIEGCRWAWHAYLLAKSLVANAKYDAILSRSLPDAGHLPALRLAGETGIPWIANWNDASGAKNPPPNGRGLDARLKYQSRQLLSRTVAGASWLTFPCERLRQYCCKYLGPLAEKKSSVIPHIALGSPRGDRTRRRNIEFTIGHAGNLYSDRNPSALFEALRSFRERDPSRKVKLLFLGLESVRLSELARRYGIVGLIEEGGSVPYLAAQSILERCDVLLVLEGPYQEGVYLPSKLVDYVQTGRPVLAVSPRVGTLADILGAFGGGLAADCVDPRAIEATLAKLYGAWCDGTLEGSYGSARLAVLFSPETVLGLYSELIDRLSRDRRARRAY